MAREKVAAYPPVVREDQAPVFDWQTELVVEAAQVGVRRPDLVLVLEKGLGLVIVVEQARAVVAHKMRIRVAWAAALQALANCDRAE